MDHNDLNAYCAELPGAKLDHPFGPETDVWKVGDKIFALSAPGSERVSLKCADAQMADMLVAMGRVGKAPYLPRGGWIAADMTQMDESELKERVLDSYQTVLAGLPSRKRAEIGA